MRPSGQADLRARWGWVLALGLAAAAVAFVVLKTPEAGRQRAAPDPPAIMRQGPVAWVRLLPAGGDDLFRLPVAVSVEGSRIRCRGTVQGARILVLTFQRRGERAAYGVYALAGAKNDLLLDAPLEGDPVTWPSRDAASALAYQLELAGLDASEARRFVEGPGRVLRGEGVRVVLTLPVDVAATIPAFADRFPGPDAPRVFLVVVDLELP